MALLFEVGDKFFHPIAKVTTEVLALPEGEDDKYNVSVKFYSEHAEVFITEAELTSLVGHGNATRWPWVLGPE